MNYALGWWVNGVDFSKNVSNVLFFLFVGTASLEHGISFGPALER